MTLFLANDTDVQFIRQMRSKIGTDRSTDAFSQPERKEYGDRQSPDTPSSLVQQFVVKSISTDTLGCRIWHNGQEGDVVVNVMKSYDLRRTPFDTLSFSDWHGTGLNTTITYQDNTHRTATETVSLNKRFEKVDPEWNVEQGTYKGDLIYATTVVGVLDPTVDSVVVWQDINESGRRWIEDEPVPSGGMTSVGAETEGESADAVTITQYPATTGKTIGWQHVQLSRVAYAASNAFYAFYRNVQYYRSGRWYRVQAESKVTIFTTTACP